jgi:hypothetical protein
MKMSLKLITPPAVEPVDLATLKKQNDVSRTDQDTLITFYGKAARIKVENFLWRKLITQTWELRLDDFPCLGSQGIYSRPTNYDVQHSIHPGGEIRIPFPPLQTIDSITYVDQNGATQTVNSSDYIVDTAMEPARVAPAYQKYWPIARKQAGSVVVRFTCGYGVAADVPETIKLAIQFLYAHLYMNREPYLTGRSETAIEIPNTITDFLDDYRIKTT